MQSPVKRSAAALQLGLVAMAAFMSRAPAGSADLQRPGVVASKQASSVLSEEPEAAHGKLIGGYLSESELSTECRLLLSSQRQGTSNHSLN